MHIKFCNECSDVLRGYHVVDAHDVRMARLPFATAQSKSHGIHSAGSSRNLEPMLLYMYAMPDDTNADHDESDV